TVWGQSGSSGIQEDNVALSFSDCGHPDWKGLTFTSDFTTEKHRALEKSCEWTKILRCPPYCLFSPFYEEFDGGRQGNNYEWGGFQKSAKTQLRVKGICGDVLKPGIHEDVKSGPRFPLYQNIPVLDKTLMLNQKMPQRAAGDLKAVVTLRHISAKPDFNSWVIATTEVAERGGVSNPIPVFSKNGSTPFCFVTSETCPSIFLTPGTSNLLYESPSTSGPDKDSVNYVSLSLVAPGI
ncbi:hypothetical protein STEG23_014970, partial [Scotinomys teguina]